MNYGSYRPKIKDIYITYEKGLEALAPHIHEALTDLMGAFPAYKDSYPITNLGNWSNPNKPIGTPYESIDWYIARAKYRAAQEGRWQTRRQISIDSLYDDLTNDPYRQKIPQLSVLIVKEDLYGTLADGQKLNFCLGVSKEDAFSIISTARFVDPQGVLDVEGFKTVVMHEFGHVLALTKPGRVHSEEALGSHCTNDGCLMQQNMNGDFSYQTQVRLWRKAHNLPPVCRDCVAEGENYFRRNLAQYLITHNNGRLR